MSSSPSATRRTRPARSSTARKRRWHWSFPDPSKATGTEAEQLATYRAVRDAIRARIEGELLPALDGGSADAAPAPTSIRP